MSEKHTSLEEKRNAILKEAKAEADGYYKKDCILRNYHTETVIQFLQKHKKYLSFMRKMLDWPEQRFIEWGCKTFEEPVESENSQNGGLWEKIRAFLSTADL